MYIVYLGVDSDGLAALLTGVGEDRLVALYAVRVVVAKNIALSGEGLVALPAAEVAGVPVLVHRLGVFPTENKLKPIATVSPSSLTQSHTSPREERLRL